MLEDIIKSKTDTAVLGFFLTAPERSFSPLEVAKRLHLSQTGASHALAKFAKQGLLKAFTKKGKKYYLINPKFKSLPEIKNYLSQNGTHYQDELYSAIRRLGHIRAAFLSGIFTGYSTLPVDMLLVGKVNLNRLHEFLKHLEKIMGQEINYSIMSVEEFEERRDTFDRFIKDIFDYRHLVVVGEIGKK